MQKVHIKLNSPNYELLTEICDKIIEVAKRTGVKFGGPIPLPTRKLSVPTRKSAGGGGTETIDKWQMRVHKRIINIESDERTLRQIMRVEIPEEVQVEIKFVE
jgi:small subunit ribosomal protein S10